MNPTVTPHTPLQNAWSFPTSITKVIFLISKILFFSKKKSIQSNMRTLKNIFSSLKNTPIKWTVVAIFYGGSLLPILYSLICINIVDQNDYEQSSDELWKYMTSKIEK